MQDCDGDGDGDGDDDGGDDGDDGNSYGDENVDDGVKGGYNKEGGDDIFYNGDDRPRRRLSSRSYLCAG
jgi:hypothetical protein